MKITQFVVLIVVIVLIFGGAAFMLQLTGGPKDTSSESSPPDTGIVLPKDLKVLTFTDPRTIDPDGRPFYAVWLKDEVETKKPGRCDFPFENQLTEPLQIGLEMKQCTCQTVDALVLTPEQLKKIPNWPPDVKNRVGANAFFGADTNLWQHLDEKASLTVPPGAKGFLRLGWSTNKQEPIRLKAALWSQTPGLPRKDLTILEVTTNIVPGVQVYPQQLGMKTVELGETKTVTCWVWSATRDKFALSPRLDPPNPAIRFSSRPLTAKETADLKEMDPTERQEAARTTVRSGYKVTIEVHNEASNKGVTVGPFDEKIFFDSEEPEVGALAELTGAIRGIVHVSSTTDEQSGKQEDVLLLGRFPADTGTTKEFSLDADAPETELEVESVSPAYLQVTIKKLSKGDEPAHWVLTLTVPPTKDSGRLPRGSHVLLKTKDKVPQHIRFLVLANKIKE